MEILKIYDPNIWPRSLVVPKPNRDIITTIQGVRRCGKSTLMGLLAKNWRLTEKNSFFINFEDPRLVNQLDHSLLDSILNHALKVSGNKKTPYLFLDEIQLIDGWEKWARLQTDSKKSAYIVVSGSNAALLSREFSSVLTGRNLNYELYPLDYTEFRKFGVFRLVKKTMVRFFYWKSKHEVDFVVKTSKGVQPIQVTWGDVKPRHQIALEEFYEAFPDALPEIYVTSENYVEFLRSIEK